uniref:Uncharacterized protein n=1 Tax=Cacopsylla melanoneura TaxID=428564 RepID=A0A8D8R0A8_9HEMI
MSCRSARTALNCLAYRFGVFRCSNTPYTGSWLLFQNRTRLTKVFDPHPNGFTRWNFPMDTNVKVDTKLSLNNNHRFTIIKICLYSLAFTTHRCYNRILCLAVGL